MHPTLLALFFEFSRTAFSMSAAGLVLLAIGLLAARRDFADARGLDKIVALSNLCVALPLAVFGAEHLSAARGIMQGVPKFMPWPLAWTYLVGFALIAASLSIATRIQVRWSGLLFGIMMFLFVAMLHFPGALASHDRFSWTVVFREMSFGGGGLVLAGVAVDESRGKGRVLVTIGRLLIAIAAIVFAVEQCLHPLGMPAVPLEKEMPVWIPLRPIIGYLTGAFLLIGGVSILLNKNTRIAATYLGSWIVLLVVAVYGPVMISALFDPSTAVKVEGLNYFADTLLFGAEFLSVASAMAERA
jgi:uncharacterized membrane protein